MTKQKFIGDLDLLYVEYYENRCSKTDLIVGIRRLRDNYIDSDINSVLPSIIESPEWLPEGEAIRALNLRESEEKMAAVKHIHQFAQGNIEKSLRWSKEFVDSL